MATNLYNTVTGAKLSSGQSYTNASGQTVTQGTAVGTYGSPTPAVSAPAPTYSSGGGSSAPAVQTNQFNTITGAKLGAGQSYVDAQGRTVTQGSALGTYGTAPVSTPAPIQSQLNVAQNNSQLTSNYTGASIVDYLNSKGKASDYNSRAGLATQNGITNYTGTAAQNTQLLNSLRSGTAGTTTTTNTNAPTSTPTTPQNNDYSTVDGHKLVQGETYTNSQGQLITQGTPISGQMGAIPDPTGTNATTGTTTPNGGTTGATGSDLAGQYSALLGNTSGVDSAQAAIDAQNLSMRLGQQNLSEQPIAMSFIGSQQQNLENRNTNLQIPLVQRLAQEQAKRQASLGSLAFALEREDKAKQSALDETYRTSTLNQKNTSQSDLYGTGIIGEYNFAKAQGYAGTFSQFQTEDANRKVSVAKAGATSVNNILPSSQDLNTKETSVALESVNQINNVLDNKDFDSAFGAQGIINRLIPGSPAKTIVALTTQILDKAAVAARGQLKGQGQVSNFEVQMLKNAQSSLSDYSIAPSAARQALIDMQGAIQTSTGGTAKVTLLDKKTGQSDARYLTSREITKAIADGLQVKYIK